MRPKWRFKRPYVLWITKSCFQHWYRENSADPLYLTNEMQALFTLLTRFLICLASFKATRRRFGRRRRSWRRRFRLRKRWRYKLRGRRWRYRGRRRRLRGLRRRRRRWRYRRRKYRGRKIRRRRRYGRRRYNRRRRRRTYLLKVSQFHNSLLVAGEKSLFFSWVLFGFPSCIMCSQNSIQMREENRKLRRKTSLGL